MNFGHGIIIALSAFVIFILTLVFSFLRQDVDLEYTDYYSRELVFNETKEATENGMPYIQFVELETGNGLLNLVFQEGFPAFDKAELHFYRADNAKLDLYKTIESGRLFQFSLEKFQPGKYELRMTWNAGDKQYSVRKNFWVIK